MSQFIRGNHTKFVVIDVRGKRAQRIHKERRLKEGELRINIGPGKQDEVSIEFTVLNSVSSLAMSLKQLPCVVSGAFHKNSAKRADMTRNR